MHWRRGDKVTWKGDDGRRHQGTVTDTDPASGLCFVKDRKTGWVYTCDEWRLMTWKPRGKR